MGLGKNTLTRMIVAAGLLCSVIGALNAQDTSSNAPAAAEQFIAGTWQVNCQPQADASVLDCALSQSIFTAQGQNLFIAFSISPAPAGFIAEPYLGVLRLPHGLALDVGIEYQIDDQDPGQMTVSTSSPQGAFARIGLTDDLIGALQRGQTLEFAFSARNGRRFFIPMSLIGFSAGFEKIR